VDGTNVPGPYTR